MEHSEYPCRLWQLYWLHRKGTVESGVPESRKASYTQRSGGEVDEGKGREAEEEAGFGVPRRATIAAWFNFVRRIRTSDGCAGLFSFPFCKFNPPSSVYFKSSLLGTKQIDRTATVFYAPLIPIITCR